MEDNFIQENTGTDLENKPKAPNGTISLICSIIGLTMTTFFIFLSNLIPDNDFADTFYGLLLLFSFVMSVIGLVNGIIGSIKIKNKRNDYSNTSSLIFGIVLGIIGIVIWVGTMALGVMVIMLTEGIEGFS